LAIQRLAIAIKGQLRLFESTPLAKDNPSAHLAILMEMARQVEQIADEVTCAKNSLPASAPENLKANAQGTFRRIGKELESVYRELHAAFAAVDEAFKDPSRAQTPFGADPFSMITQWIQLLGTLLTWIRRESRQGGRAG
jgi:hypothetical protein